MAYEEHYEKGKARVATEARADLTIRDAQGGLVREGATIAQYMGRHRTCRVRWGHHYRIMKRRTQPETLIHFCVSPDCELTGEQLHGPHPKHRES